MPLGLGLCGACCAAPTCTCALGIVSGQSTCGTTLAPVSLTGITCSGTSNPIVVTATSSNTALVANPTVNYTSPNTTGSLTLTWGSGTGSATISVTVSSTGCTPVTRTATITIQTTARPPKLDKPGDLTFHFTGTRAVTGIAASPDVPLTASGGSCATGFAGNLTISAASSNPAVIPNPAVTYTSPNTSATINLSAVIPGTATITVTVSQTNIQTFGGCCVFQSSQTFVATST